MPAAQQGLPRFCNRNIWQCTVIPVWKHIINSGEPVFQRLQQVQVPETVEEFHCAFNTSNEKSANATNYSAALQSQYGGNDDINGTMWLLK